MLIVSMCLSKGCAVVRALELSWLRSQVALNSLMMLTDDEDIDRSPGEENV